MRGGVDDQEGFCSEARPMMRADEAFSSFNKGVTVFYYTYHQKTSVLTLPGRNLILLKEKTSEEPKDKQNWLTRSLESALRAFKTIEKRKHPVRLFRPEVEKNAKEDECKDNPE